MRQVITPREEQPLLTAVTSTGEVALAPCSSGGAWDLLVDVSQHCNVKLHDAATALVATTKGEVLTEQLQRELRGPTREGGARRHREVLRRVTVADW